MPLSSHSTDKGPRVAGVVQGADDLLEIDAAAPHGAKIPAAARIAEVQMAGQDSALAVQPDDCILHVYVEDPLGELADEAGRVHSLPDQMAGIEIEAELRTVIQGLQGPLGRVQVEGDFRRMHLQRELHAALGKDVQDRVEPLGEQFEAFVDHRRRDGRKAVEQVPNARTGEAVDDADSQLPGGPGGVFHGLGCPGIHARRIAIAPDVRRQDRLMAGVDRVQHRLAHQVVADGKDLQAVPLQDSPLTAAIARIRQGLVHLEVIAEAGQLEAVESERPGQRGQGFQRKVGPLAGTQCDRTCHLDFL